MLDPAEEPLPPWWIRLRERPVTAALLALCILAYAATFSAALATADDPLRTAYRSLWSLGESDQVFIRLGALDLTRVWLEHEWWRLLSTALLHGSLVHLVLNATALVSIGEIVEKLWGSARTLLLFIVSSLAGCLASLVWCESRVVVGASAGVLGQAAALWMARRFGSPEVQRQLEIVSVTGLGVLLLLCLFLGAVVPGIAQAGHVGGFLAGVVLGWVMGARRPIWQRAVGVAVLAGGLVTLVALGRAPVANPNYHTFIGIRLLQEESTSAIPHCRTALELDPDNAVLKNEIAYGLALAEFELEWAESLIHIAREAEPSNPNYLDTLGWIWCLQGKPGQADPLLRAAFFLSKEEVPEIAEHIRNCANPRSPSP